MLIGVIVFMVFCVLMALWLIWGASDVGSAAVNAERAKVWLAMAVLVLIIYLMAGSTTTVNIHH